MSSYFNDNDQNSHNKEIIQSVKSRLDYIQSLYINKIYTPNRELISEQTLKIQLYNDLIKLLSTNHVYEDGKLKTFNLLSGRYMFIVNLFSENCADLSTDIVCGRSAPVGKSYTYSNNISTGALPEWIILFYVVERLKETFNEIARYNFPLCIDSCIEVCTQEQKYKLICINGRIARYFNTFVLCDPSHALSQEFIDTNEKHCYFMTKFHSFFIKKLKEFPLYYSAYSGENIDPIDYKEVVTNIVKNTLNILKDDVPKDLNLVSFIKSLI